jgi:LPXTG-motif cell wall-anchored protein
MGLPATGAADTLWAAIVAGALVLLAGGYVLRRRLA